MINAQHLIWIIPLSVISGGIAGMFVTCLCVASGRRNNE